MNLVKQQESQVAFSVSTQSQKMPKHCIKRWLTIHQQQFCQQIDKQNYFTNREEEHTAIHPLSFD